MRIKSYNSRERANRNEYFPAILHHPRRDQQQAASRRNSSMCQEIAGTHPPARCSASRIFHHPSRGDTPLLATHWPEAAHWLRFATPSSTEA